MHVTSKIQRRFPHLADETNIEYIDTLYTIFESKNFSVIKYCSGRNTGLALEPMSLRAILCWNSISDFVGRRKHFFQMLYGMYGWYEPIINSLPCDDKCFRCRITENISTLWFQKDIKIDPLHSIWQIIEWTTYWWGLEFL